VYFEVQIVQKKYLTTAKLNLKSLILLPSKNTNLIQISILLN